MYFAVKSCALVVLSFATFQLNKCHPNGAPVSVCDDLLPHHGVQPQTSKSPFVLKGRPKDHLVIELIIESTDDTPFRGFAIQARPVNATSGTIGKFVGKGHDIQIVFVGTVVKTAKQFWTNHLSEKISLDSHHVIEGNTSEQSPDHKV